MLIWIIDEEWKDYDLEREILEKEFPGVEIKTSTYDYKKDLEEFGYKADGVLAQVYADLPKEVIEKFENLKGIATYGGGYDRIDIDTYKEKNIHVTNIQGYCAEDLADYTIAAMFYGNKKIAQYNSRIVEDIKSNRWGAQAVDENVHRLSSSTLLIIGFGAIGKEIAKKAKALNVNVIAYDEFLSEEEIAKYGVKKVGWEEGFKEADFVSVNLKGIDANKDKLTINEFKLMKKTAYVINTSRGKVIKEDDLIQAAKEGLIAGAILDVVKVEPPTGDEEIFKCENIIITPHVSYISYESFRALKEFALQNLIAMIKGEEPRDFVC